jgi:hypothetical protein
MMIHDSVSGTIEYSWVDGIRRTASLTQTKVVLRGLPGQQTTDSQWVVHEKDPPFRSGEFTWLDYLTLDDTQWHCKLHCRWRAQSLAVRGENIHPWFEHETLSKEHNHPEDWMDFLDWNGEPWRALLLDVYPPFPASPVFRLTKL